ncbi:MAG: sulfotransferase domain-containing protein [Bryobacteraceae bacterium]
MITWLASYPRSGNTFARIALLCFFGIRSRTIYSEHPFDQVIGRPPPELTPIIGKRPPEMTAAEMAVSLERFFVKTHELPGADPSAAIYLVRDGRDTLVSYAHYILHEEHNASAACERKLFLQTLQDLIVGEERFGGWASNVRAWTQRSAPTGLLHFEDLIADPEKEIRQALIELGEVPVLHTDASLPAFESLHHVAPWFFRTGRAGAWRTEMPSYLQALFWRLHGDVMTHLGYDEEGTAARAESPNSILPRKA